MSARSPNPLRSLWAWISAKIDAAIFASHGVHLFKGHRS